MRLRYIIALASLLLLPASALADTGFSTILTGAQENPPVATPGTGTATLTLNTAQTHLTYSVTFSGLIGNTTASHIHKAPVGVNGPVQIGLNPPLGVTAGSYNGVLALTAAQVADLLAGLYYINLHSTSFPGGEIRGQINMDVTPARAGTWGRIKALFRR